jgi:hypothetical protein
MEAITTGNRASTSLTRSIPTLSFRFGEDARALLISSAPMVKTQPSGDYFSCCNTAEFAGQAVLPSQPRSSRACPLPPVHRRWDGLTGEDCIATTLGLTKRDIDLVGHASTLTPERVFPWSKCRFCQA